MSTTSPTSHTPSGSSTARAPATRQITAALGLLAMALATASLPAAHSHWLAERTIAAHTHDAAPEASAERCGGRTHLHRAHTLRHPACLACVGATHQLRVQGPPAALGDRWVSEPARCEPLVADGATRDPWVLPPGRSPPAA